MTIDGATTVASLIVTVGRIFASGECFAGAWGWSSECYVAASRRHPSSRGLLIATLVAARAGEPRALLELFTSQGCSSCPAADKLLGDLAVDPSLIALSVPIDYWDYLGWKDTLASPAHSARQRAYARVRGDRQVYTPQIVVNGGMHVLGSDRAAIERAIAQTDQKPGVMSLPVLMSVGGDEFERQSRVGGKRACDRRSLAVSARQGGAGRDRPRRKSRTHHHLPQCGAALGEARRLDRDAGKLDRPDRRNSRPTTSMPPPSWCRKARTTSRASSSARPTSR